MAIAPHGGELVDRLLTGPALEAAKDKAESLPKIKVDTYAAFDIDGIAKGLFSPITGFMNEVDTRRVLDTMYLRDGLCRRNRQAHDLCRRTPDGYIAAGRCG